MSKTETAIKEAPDKHPASDSAEGTSTTASTRERFVSDLLSDSNKANSDETISAQTPGKSADVKPASERPEQTVNDAVDALPEVEVTDDGSADEGGGESRFSEQFQYRTEPSEAVVSADQALSTFASALAPKFYGDSYPVFAQDPFILSQFEKAFTQALAFANNISPDATVSQGHTLIVPGQNSEGEPLFMKDGIWRQWSSNTVDTLEKDGTRRTQFDDGTNYVFKPDGTSVKTDVLGVVETSRTLPDGTFERQRSDGTYEKRFTDGSSELGGSNGVKTHVAADRTITTTYRNGEISTLKPDGTQILVRPDKSVMTTERDATSRTVDKDGQLIGLAVFGNEVSISFKPGEDPKRNSVMSGRARPDWTFTLRTDADGNVEISDGKPPRDLRPVSEGDFRILEETREKLFAQSEQNFDDPITTAKFKADLIRFENRAKERGLSAKAVLDVYKNLDKLLSPNADAKIDQKGRSQIAAELTGDLANPYSISQGAHGTCNVKILQVMLSAKHPERVANLIAEAALTGKHTLPSGESITLPESTLTPHNDAIGYPHPNGARGFAGQVFDSAAVNTLLQMQKMPYRFDQLEPDPSLKGYKSGDILVDNETGKPLTDPLTGNVREFNGLAAPQIVEVYKHLMSGSTNEDWLLDPNFPKADTTDGIRTFDSPQELSSILKGLKEQGQFPFPIFVDTRMAPFWADSNGGLAGGSGGAHVLNIADYDPVSNSVLIDNQWSSHDDRLDASKAVPVDQLFSASVHRTRLMSMITDDAKARAGDDHHLRDRLILTRLNDALKDSDPNLLRREYDVYSQVLGLELAGTKRGDPANAEIMQLFRSLSPVGKLSALRSLTTSATAYGGEQSSMSAEEYKNVVVEIASEFGMSVPYIYRGLQTRPETIEQGIRANVINDTAPGKEAYNQGRLDVINLLANMPEATRTRMLGYIQADFDRRNQEAREFAAKYAE